MRPVMVPKMLRICSRPVPGRDPKSEEGGGMDCSRLRERGIRALRATEWEEAGGPVSLVELLSSLRLRVERAGRSRVDRSPTSD
jgi:hypothetical protein